jgi:chromate reductase, NAD(P)H dehydrogenase (quinone)
MTCTARLYAIMITIISGTDRKDGLTHILAEHYAQVMRSKTTEEVKLYSLEDLPHALFGPLMYKEQTISEDFLAIEETFMIPADKLFFVIPEYNGSFPGILKLFVDACSIRSKMAIFKGKKAGMVGLATGRAGNIRGLEHFTSILMFMGVTVLPNLLPISSFKKTLDAELKSISDEGTLKVIDAQIEAFLKF